MFRRRGEYWCSALKSETCRLSRQGAHGPFDGERLNERDWKIPCRSLAAPLAIILTMNGGEVTLQQSRTPDRYAELLEDFGTPLRLINVCVEMESLNQIADSLPVDWVNAHDAIDMLLSMFGNGMGVAAGISLAKRAHKWIGQIAGAPVQMGRKRRNTLWQEQQNST
jgi:hypothetical protein